jgi:hypothetical protein
MNPLAFRIAKYLFIFVIFFIVFDQGIYWIGRALLKPSDYLVKDFIFSKIQTSSTQDAFIIGSCRGVVGINPTIVNEGAGITSFNACRVSSLLATHLMTLNLILSHHRPKYIIFVIDDGNWMTSFESEQQDIERHLLWFPLLKKEYQDQLVSLFKIPSWKLYSGLYINKGKAWEVLKNIKYHIEGRPDSFKTYSTQTALRDWLKQHPSASVDIQSLSSTAICDTILKQVIENCLAVDVIPVLVTVPMYHLRTSDDAVDWQHRRITQLATQYGIPYFFYLDNYSDYAQNDLFWHDVGHMNASGSVKFSREFSKDLAKYLYHQK